MPQRLTRTLLRRLPTSLRFGLDDEHLTGFAFGPDVEGSAADLTIGDEILISLGGIDLQIVALAAVRAN